MKITRYSLIIALESIQQDIFIHSRNVKSIEISNINEKNTDL